FRKVPTGLAPCGGGVRRGQTYVQRTRLTLVSPGILFLSRPRLRKLILDGLLGPDNLILLDAPRRDDAHPAQYILAGVADLVALVGRDVDNIALLHRDNLVAKQDFARAAHEHHAMVIGVVLLAGVAARLKLVVAQSEVLGLLPLADKPCLGRAGCVLAVDARARTVPLHVLVPLADKSVNNGHNLLSPCSMCYASRVGCAVDSTTSRKRRQFSTRSGPMVKSPPLISRITSFP